MPVTARDQVTAPDRTAPGRVSVRNRPALRRGVMAALCLLVLAGIGWAVWFWPHRSGNGAGEGRSHDQPIPVLVERSATRDVPIYLDGLGTVQAFNTVTVKAMVDGPLTEVRFKEGQDVGVGDVLARIDARAYQAALDQAVAKKSQDQANLANARLDLGRYQKLAATAYSSAQQADTQKAVVAQLEAQVQQDQAQIDTAQTQLSYTTITAPIAGRVGIRQVDAGNIVRAADTTGIVVLTTLQPISVVFTLPQQNLEAVAAAMQVDSPEVLALTQGSDGSQGAVLDRGVLAVLDNQVDQTTGTIKLKATFPNTERKLWPGGFVSVRLRVRSAHDAVVVPPAAIQRGPRGSYVYVVNGDNAVARRPVTVGHEDMQSSIVTQGLQPNETVVVDGASRLTEGSRVVIARPDDAGTTAPAQPSAPGAGARRGRNTGAT
ncbi:MAG: efflux RND transporter periplasmic adaptor subunit [Geminicoccaceae bacterium]